MGESIFYRAGDDLWFMGIYSNNFEDVEGDTFTEESHQEYAQWLKNSGVKPPITVLHQPHYQDEVHVAHYLGLVMGKLTAQEFSDNLTKMYKPYAIAETKAVISVNGFNIVIGKVYDNKRELVEQLTERSDGWGMSHGFLVTKSDGDNTILKYRSFEFSILPEVLAANRATTIGFVKRGKDMGAMLKGMSQEDRALLEQLLDDSIDPADVEEGTKLAKSILSRFLGSKAVEDEEAEQPAEETVEEEKVEEVVVEETVETVEEVVEEAEEKALSYESLRAQLVKDFKIEELTEALKAIDAKFTEIDALLATVNSRFTTHETDIKALKASEDEKIAAAFTAPDWTLGLMGRSVATKKAAEEDDTQLLEDLKKDLPVDDKAKEDNPLFLGLGQLFS